MELAEPSKHRVVDVQLDGTGAHLTVAGTESSLSDWLRRLVPPVVTPTPPVEPIIVVNVKRDDQHVGEFSLAEAATRQALIAEISGYGAVDAVELRVTEIGPTSVAQIEAGILAASSLGLDARLLIVESE